MCSDKKENIGCLISTIVIITLVIIGFFYFTRQFAGISSVACVFILPFLPFIVYHQRCQERKRIASEYEIQNNIQEYAEMLKDLSGDIEDYNPEEDEESPSEYLESVKDEIVSITKNLEGLIKDDISF